MVGECRCIVHARTAAPRSWSLPGSGCCTPRPYKSEPLPVQALHIPLHIAPTVKSGTALNAKGLHSVSEVGARGAQVFTRPERCVAHHFGFANVKAVSLLFAVNLDDVCG